MAGQLARSVSLAGMLRVQPPPAAGPGATRVAEGLRALLEKGGRPTARTLSDAAAVVVPLAGAQLDTVEGRRSRTLALLTPVVSTKTGELLAVCGSRRQTRLDHHGSGEPTAHPTASELLDLAAEVGEALRQKLTQPGFSLPPAGVVVEVQPVRDRTGRQIQADIAALWILKSMGTVPGVRVVLGSRWGVPPPGANALIATHVLRAELAASGGAGEDSPLAVHLVARLVPLISTNAPLVEADATLLPPLVPDRQ